MIRADDALKYAAALLESRTDWAIDSIAGSLCDTNAGHEDELDAINGAVTDVLNLAAQFGSRLHYSDGRRVKTSQEIQPGLVTSHVWHPDPQSEEPESWRANLPSDPGAPSPGIYEVSTHPTTQTIHVRTVRLAGS